jgi:hypothetical protein
MSAQATEQRSAIELVVEQDPMGQVAATVPVRWAISPEMVERLAEVVANPYMLLVITSGAHELDRYLVPLKAGMTFLQMRRPGTLTIHATIVWQKQGGDSVKSVVMKKDDHGLYRLDLIRTFIPGLAEVIDRLDELDEEMEAASYGSALYEQMKAERKQLRRRVDKLHDDGTEVLGLYDGFHAIERTAESDQINIEVPSEMFAKQPPSWMSWLGDLYKWPRKARDQCDLRRRAIFTAFTLPLLVPIGIVIGVLAAFCWMLVKLSAIVITGVLLFFGKRGLDYSVIYEWDSLDLKDIWYRAKPSFWLYKKTEVTQPHDWYPDRTVTTTEYVRRDVAFSFINPPFVLVSFIVGRLLDEVIGSGSSIASGVISAAIGAVFIGVVASVATKQYQKRKANATEKPVLTDEQKSKLERELLLLTAGGSAKLSDLPTRQRSFRLRYLNLKASVCKPFAR